MEQVTAVFFTKNRITIQKFNEFKVFIEQILNTDPKDLYVQQIEKTAAEEESEASGLGLLTMLNDYSAKLGWKFEWNSSNTQIVNVTTMAQVVI